jgi:hypothetical protein
MMQKEHTTAAVTTLTGGFQWKPEWRTQLPVVRGIHAPKMETLKKLLANPVMLPNQETDAIAYSFARLAKEAGYSWPRWDKQTAHEHISRLAESKPDASYWLELMARAYCNQESEDKQLHWMTQVCIGLHGPAFTLRVCMSLWQATGRSGWVIEMLAPLRQAIACAEEPQYQQAQAVAQVLKTQSPAQHRACAYLFAHIGEWAEEWLAQHDVPNSDEYNFLLKDCVLPAAVFARYVERQDNLLWTSSFGRRQKRAMLLLQVHLHQDAALQAMSLLLESAIYHSVYYSDKDALLLLLEVMVCMHVPQMPVLLARGMASPKVRSALEMLAEQFPVAVLKAVMEHSLAGRNPVEESWAIRLALHHSATVPDLLTVLEPDIRNRFETLWAACHRKTAELENLPPLLREPPWLRADRPLPLPAFDVPVLPTPDALVWPDQPEGPIPSKKEAASYRPDSLPRSENDEFGFPSCLGLTPEGAQRLLAGFALEPGDIQNIQLFRGNFGHILYSPEQAQLALWNAYPGESGRDWNADKAIPALLAKFGAAAVPGAVAYLNTHDWKPWLASMVDSPGLVNHALHALRNVRRHKESAGQWVMQFPRTVLFKALPQAFATEYSPARDDAHHAIVWLVEKGHCDLAREVAGIYGGAMLTALEALLTDDPIFHLPDVMPDLPHFFVAASFHHPELNSGGVLPVVAMEHIGRMLMLEQPGPIYAGIDIIKQSCTRASLAEFAWDIYEAWVASERPKKYGWAFTSLGLLGDDNTARRLFKLINEWAVNPNLRARATVAMDILRVIGSDVSLMLLSVIATKSKHKTLQERAAVMIQTAANTRGLNQEELADRLVPALGLDQENAFELDFGPRKFTLSFDEELKPVVMDSKDTRLKDLPKPNKSDDAALAKATSDRLKLLRKDARTLASLQITRMERAMVNARRWPLAEFKRFFIDHPLMRYLVARLVWGRYEGDKLVQALRIAEDWTLADSGDELVELPDDAVLGIPHVLELSPDMLTQFSQVFADYEILQPFKQLGRETYALTPDEQKQHILKRFEGQSVASGAIMSLQPRGWERGHPQDGGMICDYSRRSKDGLEVSLSISPGLFIGGGMMEPRQDIGELWLRRHTEGAAPHRVGFGGLNPIFISEVLRDLSQLNPYNIMTAP